MLPSGFNVIGFVSANLGLGMAARNTIRLLLECNQPVSVVDVDAGFGRSGADHTFDHLKVPGNGEPPYAINLIHLNPPEYTALCRKGIPWILPGNRFNAIVPFWELPIVPRPWLQALGQTDLILAPTHFIEHMMTVQVSGVPVRHYPQTVFLPGDIAPDRASFGLPPDHLLFVMSFEMFSDINRKNPMAVIEAFSRAFPDENRAMLVVKVNNAGAHASFSAPLERLRAAAAGDRRIVIIDRPLSHRDVLRLYASCDVLVSLHRAEGLGLSPLEAMTLGKPVIATDWSGNMDFMTDGNACLVGHRLVPVHSDAQSGYNIGYVGAETVWADPEVGEAALWMRRLSESPALRAAIGARAAADMRERHLTCCRGELWNRLHRLREVTDQPRESRSRGRSVNVRRGMRILFCNRGNAFDLPGGDTVVMKRLKEGLEKRGITVDFTNDPRSTDVRRYTMIHGFNLTLPAVADATAKAAIIGNVPFVMTTLQEDFPRYYHKAATAFSWFNAYAGADASAREAMMPLDAALAAATPVPLCTAPFAARAASLLFACSASEAENLRGWFGHNRIAVTPFGSSVRDLPVKASLFEEQFGVKDFILCVGRVEPRKNQLMLLYALRESAVPIVFADGGFTYQPAYLTLCKGMRRKGRTLYTGRLSDELLVSGYRACRLHCLPSWYELPGLVSLEAARYGCAVAASSWGALPDYLGDAAAWFEPDRPAEIHSLIESGFGRSALPAAQNAAERARSFSWESFVEQTVLHYERVPEEHAGYPAALVAEAQASPPAMTIAAFIGTIVALVEKGKTADALTYYDAARSSVHETMPELDKVDSLMEKMRGMKLVRG